MKYLLLDTNVYLHYIDFEQVDWAAIVGDKEYAILVPFIVIKEIDKYKDGPKNKIKTRARAVSSKFGSYFLDDSCERKINLIPLSEPSDDVLKINCLNNRSKMFLSFCCYNPFQTIFYIYHFPCR